MARARPLGAGKTTFFEAFLADSGLPFMNADRLALALAPDDPAKVAYQAAGLAELERRRLLAEGRSFCMETVFSDPAGDKLRLLKEAQAIGYRVVLVFIGLWAVLVLARKQVSTMAFLFICRLLEDAEQKLILFWRLLENHYRVAELDDGEKVGLICTRGPDEKAEIIVANLISDGNTVETP